MTENVWPWSHLVPFFMEDMRARASALAGQLQEAEEEAQGAAQPQRSPTAAWGVPWKRWGRRNSRNSNSNSDSNLGAGGRADAWAHVRHPDGDRFFYNAARGESKWLLSAEEQEQEVVLPELDPYNNPLAMSLEEFVEHPIAGELLHDGQAYQVGQPGWGIAGHCWSGAWARNGF